MAKKGSAVRANMKLTRAMKKVLSDAIDVAGYDMATAEWPMSVEDFEQMVEESAQQLLTEKEYKKLKPLLPSLARTALDVAIHEGWIAEFVDSETNEHVCVAV